MLHEYLKDYQSLVQVLEHYRATIGAAIPYIESVKVQVKNVAPTGTTTTAL
jgi:hypothetical protein